MNPRLLSVSYSLTLRSILNFFFHPHRQLRSRQCHQPELNEQRIIYLIRDTNLKIIWAPHLPVAKSSNDGLLSQEKLSQKCKTRRQIDPEPLQSRVKLRHKQLAMVSLFQITIILTVAVSS